jgi:hypothetical protein
MRTNLAGPWRLVTIFLGHYTSHYGSVAVSQSTPEPDSLVAAFVTNGVVAGGWSPHAIFENCPELAPWQQKAFDLLRSANLPHHREEQLVVAWGTALQHCRTAELEEWFLERTTGTLERPTAPTFSYWWVLTRYSSPRVDEQLFQWMVNVTLPDKFRDDAATAWIADTTPDRLEQWKRGFQSGKMPWSISNGLTGALLSQAPVQLLEAAGDIIGQRPELSQQTAFVALVEGAPGRAPDSALRRFAEDIKAALDSGSPSPEDRRRLKAALAHLTRTAGKL